MKVSIEWTYKISFVRFELEFDSSVGSIGCVQDCFGISNLSKRVVQVSAIRF